MPLARASEHTWNRAIVVYFYKILSAVGLFTVGMREFYLRKYPYVRST